MTNTQAAKTMIIFCSIVIVIASVVWNRVSANDEACYHHRQVEAVMNDLQLLADNSTGYRHTHYRTRMFELFDTWRVTGDLCFSN